MHEEGCGRTEKSMAPVKRLRWSQKLSPVSMPSALGSTTSFHSPSHLCNLGSGLGCKFRWDAQAGGEGRRLLPEGERATFRERKAKQEERVNSVKVAVQELDKSLSPGGAPGCPQKKQQPCLSLSSSLPISPTKEWGKGEDKYFLHRKYHVTKKKETTLQSICYFYFFHISSLLFLAKSLGLYVFPSPNCFTLFEVYWKVLLFREVRSEQGPVLHTSREEEAFPLKSLPSSFLSSFSNHTFLSASFSLSKRELLPLVTVKQQRWVMLQTATGAAWEPR